ncbi:MAG: N-acetylmuramoyl-L-alanine amidase [Deltaproteobacteria bacterium]|nr:N-acetylmuramoyl-L-alanine amidase [Deltaproteobacteria bacterium]
MRTPILRLTLLSFLIAGCAAQPGSLSGGTGHSAAESRVTAEVIAATWQRDGDWLVSPILAAPGGATRVGVLITLAAAGDMPDIEARPMRDARPLSDWAPLTQTWGEEDTHVAITDLSELAQGAQLRIPAAIIDRLLSLRFDAVIPDAIEPETAGDAFDTPTVGAGREALRSELGGLGIVTREAWGARPTRCRSSDPRKVKMAIHETVTPSTNPARQVRGIQRYHMDTRGWCDVGYHFLVSTDGTVYEGRPLNLRGAHVGRHNTGNIGIAHIGCFHSSSCSRFAPNRPPEAMIRATSRLVGELSRLYGISIDTDTVKGHRDFAGASTSCPGDYLEARLPDIRRLASDPSGAGDSGAAPAPAPSDPPPADPPAPAPADPSACGGLACGSCEATAGCGYCASTGACQSDAEVCSWRGQVERNVCWDARRGELLEPHARSSDLRRHGARRGLLQRPLWRAPLLDDAARGRPHHPTSRAHGRQPAPGALGRGPRWTHDLRRRRGRSPPRGQRARRQHGSRRLGRTGHSGVEP